LAGVEGDVLDDAVALVEDAEDRHALRHRRDVRLAGVRPRTLFGRGLILLLAPAIARCEREPDQQRSNGLAHAYSGIHGS
jgi:hypothetical protein